MSVLALFRLIYCKLQCSLGINQCVTTSLLYILSAIAFR